MRACESAAMPGKAEAQLLINKKIKYKGKKIQTRRDDEIHHADGGFQVLVKVGVFAAFLGGVL